MNTMNRSIILSILVMCSGCSFNPEKYIDDLEDFVRFETAFDVAGSQEPVNAYIISTSSDYLMCWAFNMQCRDMLLRRIEDAAIEKKEFVNPNPVFYDSGEAYKYMCSKVLYYYDTVPVDFSEFKKVNRDIFTVVETNTFMTYQIRKVSQYTLDEENVYGDGASSFDELFEFAGEKSRIKFFFKYYLNYRFKKFAVYQRLDGKQEID